MHVIRSHKQKGIAAVGTIIAVIAALGIAAAAGMYTSLRQKERLQDNQLITQLKQQAEAFRNEVITLSDQNDESAMAAYYSGTAWIFPNTTTKKYSYAPSDSNSVWAAAPTYFYTTPNANKVVLAHYAEDPRLRSQQQDSNDDTMFFNEARYSHIVGINLDYESAEGISKWLYRHSTEGVYLFIDAIKTLPNGKPNTYYNKGTMAKLVKSLGSNDATLCQEANYDRTIVWIRKLTLATAGVCQR